MMIGIEVMVNFERAQFCSAGRQMGWGLGVSEGMKINSDGISWHVGGVK